MNSLRQLPVALLFCGTICLCAEKRAEAFITASAVPGGLTVPAEAAPVVIAIIDDGVRLDHSEIAPFLPWNRFEVPGNGLDDDGNGYADDGFGWDFGDKDADPQPAEERLGEYDHGTHLAGILAQVLRHAFAKSAPAAFRFLPVKVISDKASTTALRETEAGLAYAVEANADIILCAWGEAGISARMRNLLNEAERRGAVVIAAAGNIPQEQDRYPAAHPTVLAVSGHDALGRKLPDATYGAFVDLTAPGEDIAAAEATSVSERHLRSGTSQAAAVVAGAAAILKIRHPQWKPLQVRAALINNATFAAQNLAFTGRLGAGKLHVGNALANGYHHQPARLLAGRGVLVLDPARPRKVRFGPYEGIAGVRLRFSEASRPPGNGRFRMRASSSGEGPGSVVPVASLPESLYLPGKAPILAYEPGTADASGEWLLDFRAVPEVVRNRFCGDPQYLSEPGLIEDGSGPGPYAPDSDCKWYIKAPPGKVIRFTFREFETEPLVDKLYFFNGAATSAPIMAICSGDTPPEAIVSWRNEALLWFVSDSRNHADGFAIAYEFVDPQGF